MNRAILLLTIFLTLFAFSVSSAKEKEPFILHTEGEYITLGSIDNPILRSLIKESRNTVHAFSKKSSKKCPGLILDSNKVKPKEIEKSSIIKKAIKKSIPIIMSQPSKANMHALTGFEMSDQQHVVVIIPKKQGEEYEIHVINKESDQKVHALSNDHFFVNTINSIVQTHNTQLQGKKSDQESAITHPHKRWTVLDEFPTIWGKQNQFIHVGFQYDLYYICEPWPPQKCLLMRTIGMGVAAGTLRHDNNMHRGYYQNKVIVDIAGKRNTGWKGEDPLTLKEYAPQSENSLNQEQNTHGLLMALNGTAGIASFGNSAMANTGMSAGVGMYDQHSVTSKFDDFTVSFMPTVGSDRWEFWMNGASGAKVRKKCQTWDLTTYHKGFCTLRELPQLASMSVLQPDVLALYTTRGDQTGKWTLTGSITQRLRDVQSWMVYGKTKKDSKTIDQPITIDFSEVSGDANSQCDKK